MSELEHGIRVVPSTRLRRGERPWLWQAVCTCKGPLGPPTSKLRATADGVQHEQELGEKGTV